jgi:hypothetical protein
VSVALKSLAVTLLLALALLAAQPHVTAERTPAGASHAAPMAFINIGELFGDENEPDEDENEADEGSPQRDRSSDDEAGDEGAGVPFGIMLGLVLAAGLLVAYVVVRVRRLVLRARAWGRDLWARL